MWHSKRVPISTDGERTMTGCISGVQKRFEEAAEHPIVRIWCGLHQVYLVAQQEHEALCYYKFILTLISLIAYLLHQKSILIEMKTTCPKFVRTRWLSMKCVTPWLKTNRVRVTEKSNTKKPTCTPTAEWWIMLLCINSVATIILSTLSKLQVLITLILHQEAQLKEICTSLGNLQVWGPMVIQSACGTGLGHIFQSRAVLGGVFWCKPFCLRPRDVGDWYFGDNSTREHSVYQAGYFNLFAGLYAIIVDIFTTRDPNNQSSMDALKPVLLYILAVICTRELWKMIHPHHVRLEKAGWTIQQINQVGEEHWKLQRAVNSKDKFKELLYRCSDTKTGSMEVWELCQGCFNKLQLLAGGLASMFPNTATVQLDFSIIGTEKYVLSVSDRLFDQGYSTCQSIQNSFLNAHQIDAIIHTIYRQFRITTDSHYLKTTLSHH